MTNKEKRSCKYKSSDECSNNERQIISVIAEEYETERVVGYNNGDGDRIERSRLESSMIVLKK